ncbi:hypothetical protein RF11_06051 [Thelohanellus kitauei]|uniref:Uncharacterized protein n=1 Tax=Thelohanellus kitauei TaxID=669202 RepID=A0A0C2JRA8_THEKT|nr:hypothetical protein RF11_06051 [Thelohanellus kitauei]
MALLITKSVKVVFHSMDMHKKPFPWRSKIDNEKIIVTVNHSIVPDITRINCRRIRNKIKQMTVESHLMSNQQIFANTTANISKPIVPALPSFKKVSRTIQIVRLKQTNRMPLSRPVEQLIIPELCKITKTGERFLSVEATISGQGFLIFTTNENLNLSESRSWFIDGTFSACSNLFEQFYPIRTIVSNKIIPLIYGLLPFKNAMIYRNFLTSVQNLNHLSIRIE